MQGTWVRSLVRELRSHMLHGLARKKMQMTTEPTSEGFCEDCAFIQQIEQGLAYIAKSADKCYSIHIKKMLVCVLGCEALRCVNKISSLMESLHSRREC